MHPQTAFNDKHTCNDDNVPTSSSDEQAHVEDVCKRTMIMTTTAHLGRQPQLLRDKHVAYILSSLHRLGKSYESLDASRPWMVYWSLHSLALMNFRVDDALALKLINFLHACRTSTGGYAGGPGQQAHLATTYAAVMALCELRSVPAYASIDRASLRTFLRSLHNTTDSSYSMHVGGERDVRGVYCALAVAGIMRMLDDDTTLIADVHLWTLTCQTYEGGFSGEPGGEAHGGYTYCALAALRIIDKHRLIDTDRLLRWLVRRQMSYEGGFQGRTNKLVDGCYSFWQGGAFPIIQELLSSEYKSVDIVPDSLMNARALCEYIIYCCQDTNNGGLIDKPGKSRDLYHTCYVLSGLATAQCALADRDEFGDQLTLTHPLYNVTMDAYDNWQEYLQQGDIVSV